MSRAVGALTMRMSFCVKLCITRLFFYKKVKIWVEPQSFLTISKIEPQIFFILMIILSLKISYFLIFWLLFSLKSMVFPLNSSQNVVLSHKKLFSTQFWPYFSGGLNFSRPKFFLTHKFFGTNFLHPNFFELKKVLTKIFEHNFFWQ